MPRPDAAKPDAAVARRLLAVLVGVCLIAGLQAMATGPPAQGPGPAGESPASHSLDALGDELGLTRAELETLEAGGPVVRAPGEEAAPGASAGLAYRVIPAPAQRLARAVGDWTHYEEFFPFVLSSEVTAAPGGEIRVTQRVDTPFPFPDRHFTLRSERPAPPPAASGPSALELTWSHVPGTGNIAAQEGGWRLWPMAPGANGSAASTLVELRLASDAGAGVPDGLERRALLETLAWALDGLRQQVNRCRYDLPIHPTCREAPPEPAWDLPVWGLHQELRE